MPSHNMEGTGNDQYLYLTEDNGRQAVFWERAVGGRLSEIFRYGNVKVPASREADAKHGRYL